MALRCPKCRSNRVRKGYENPAFILRMVGMHGLLCENCNLSYIGFAIPGTVPLHARGKKKTRKTGYTVNREQKPPEDQITVKYSHRLREDENPSVSEVIAFSWYYVKLRARVMLGLHHTSHSMSVKYRWHNWQHWQREKRQ